MVRAVIPSEDDIESYNSSMMRRLIKDELIEKKEITEDGVFRH
jgi:hypothetical protein